ncbi:MAG: ribosome small subunit-dependent GTPase A [Clostridia bacterium]|nr:ribosome small subunit-dependent GTPase A [Clostridia bacterium]
MPTGTIIKGIGGFYYVKTDEGIYECKARGIFRKENLTPLPGDKVSIVIDKTGSKGSIDEILPRETELVRPAVSNVNQMIVVVAAKSPAPDLVLLDKLLITAELKGISTVICLNKIDLDESKEYLEFMESYKKAGYEVIKSSSKANEGYEELLKILKGKITVFAGQSGVGKSTILNRLMKSSIMQTGDVSQKIERGKHTTRHAELVELSSGGYIVDTPGFSSFELTEIEHIDLELYYPEFSQFINRCRFTGCSHISEPDCLVKQAVDDNIIDRGRYERYITLYNLLKENRLYRGKGNKQQGKCRK